MKVLLLDHVCHKKTKSFDFFVQLLKDSGVETDVFYYERYYHFTVPAEKISWADVIVHLEFLPSRFNVAILGKPNVFVPMYDNEWGSYWQWKRIAWSGMGVVSFSKKVSDHARKCGVKSLLNVQYFLDPTKFPQRQGERKRVFLWERGTIDRKTAEILFPPCEGYVFDIKKADEFLERDAYLDRIARCDIVIAPRRKEGIGMVFLEAMAMGKVVAVHDDATMNEYIIDGKNGVLFDADNPSPISDAKLEKVRLGISSIETQLDRWRNDVTKIPSFIAAQKPCCPGLVGGMKMELAYPVLLFERIVKLLTNSDW